MKDYITESIEAFGEKITWKATSAAKRNLFDTEFKNVLLVEERRVVLHSIVQKLLYVGNRGRPDIQTAIAFLCTRVSKATEGDWAKLRRVLEYLKCTIDLPRIIGADNFDTLLTWVDVSYGVHEDAKSHTGGLMSFGTGIINPKSTKQKLNTKSSTEGELVGASDYLPNVIWTKMFLEEQGYEIKDNVFYQDNKSTILLEQNRRNSCGPKSKHIHIRYFFIKDRIKTEKMRIKHWPTDVMIADFFTKPLQGSLFRKFRDVILGLTSPSSLIIEKSTTVQERVEIKLKDGKAKNIKIEDDEKTRNIIQEGHGKRISWSDVVKRKDKVPLKVLNGPFRS